MFVKNFEKTAVVGFAKAVGKEMWAGLKPTKMNTGLNALSAYDTASTISKKMKVPLGAPREL